MLMKVRSQWLETGRADRSGLRVGRFGGVSGLGAVEARMRELHAKDRDVLDGWWEAQSAVLKATRERNHVREAAGRRELRQLSGGVTARQATWAQRAKSGPGRPVSAAARRLQLRVAATEPRLLEARTRQERRLVEEEAKLNAVQRNLVEATRILSAHLPWADELIARTADKLPRPMRQGGT
jgi:hypothetical protein